MRIEHAALYVRDLEKTRDFFTRFFKAAPSELYHNPQTGFSSYFLSFEDGARLEIMNKTGLQQQDLSVAAVGYAHLAFSVGSKEEVDRFTEELRENGYPILSGPRTTGDGYYESVIAACEGIQIEITE